MGLRFLMAGASAAYVEKYFSASLADAYVGQWLLFPASMADNGGFFPVSIRLGSSAWPGLVLKFTAGGDQYRLFDGAGYCADYTSLPIALRDGRWHYHVLRSRAGWDDGVMAYWLDGVLVAEFTGRSMIGLHSRVRVGVATSFSPYMSDSFDLDETKVAASYPEPFAAEPVGEYPSPARTVVLFRGASGESRQFADACVAECGIPRANLLRLDAASSAETLGDYATFQSQIENPLAAFLALHPTLAERCMTFLIGYGVPGYFVHAGTVHSAANRLMNLGTAFSSQAVNPLYAPETVERLSKSGLAGKYLCCRIDAASLQAAVDLLGLGGAISDIFALPDADTLYCDDDAYRASLACQKLRILTAGLGSFIDDAFVFGNTGDPSFGGAGTRAGFVNPAPGGAASLRSGTCPCLKALFQAYYGAALGCSDASDSFDAGSFFEMLRIGGTFAEAAIVAVAHLDWMALPAGSPLMTVAFEKGGYNIYRGIGGAEHIDWDNPVACARLDQDAVSFVQSLPEGVPSVYGIRAVSQAGLEGSSTHVLAYVESAPDGQLLPAPLARPDDLTASMQGDGSLLVGFSYYPPPGFAMAEAFDVLSDHGTGQLDEDDPIAAVEQFLAGQREFELCLTTPQRPFLLAVRARGGGRTGPLSVAVLVSFCPPPEPAEVL